MYAGFSVGGLGEGCHNTEEFGMKFDLTKLRMMVEALPDGQKSTQW